MIGAPTTRPDRAALADELMRDFARRTGLVGGSPPRRYLWTDAFAVCNFLGAWRRDGDRAQLALALRLVDQVHHELGQHRADDSRNGWISGLEDAVAERHPTAGGLRVGKALPERTPEERYDARLEWERDGQYFHYLTRWMHALARVAEETGEARYLRWARELALAAHAAFARRALDGATGLAWKMSIDLKRPLVPATGHHDVLDAFTTYLELERLGARLDVADADAGTGLATELSSATAMCAGALWITDDPLGLGGVLTAGARLAALGTDDEKVRRMARRALTDGASGLRYLARSAPFALHASRRLAFRELGLAIGLHAVSALESLAHVDGDDQAFAAIRLAQPLAERLEEFWSDPANQHVPTWNDHLDINAVTLATCLDPSGYLGTPAPRSAE